MRYDSVVVGAGLAGLSAALRLAEQGQRVLVVAKGVGATHLAPGTIDVLGYAERRVASPSRTLRSFVAARPEHPYARVEPQLVKEGLEWFKGRLVELGYRGSLDQNLLLPTAVGAAKPSALVPESMLGGDLRGGGRFAIVGLRGLKDFYPAYVADNLGHVALRDGRPIRARPLELNLNGAGDVGSLGFARRFESSQFRDAVVRDLARRLMPGERVGFPAVLGLHGAREAWQDLQERLGEPVFEIPTLPPSVSGMRVFQALSDRIRRTGSRIVIGDAVVGAETRGRRVEGIRTQTAARAVTVGAERFLLASGGFASAGLQLDSRGSVRETVFDLPVAGVPDRGEPRFAPDYFGRHPLGRAGVQVDGRFRPVDGRGEPVYDNLFAAGATLAGAEPWREASGNGLALSTGYAAAASMLEPS
jgi:glycerol-3-phosphate dehydrogenase subunit B